jgi:hypothetical protein
MTAALLLAAALVANSVASVPQAEDIARMNRTFAHTHEVRVLFTTPEPEMYVTRPHALAAGLDYEKTPGTPRRPSLIHEPDTTPAPPRPIPWSAIQRVEWRHGGTQTGILVGTLTAAVILGGVVAMVNASGTDVAPSPPGVILGAAAGGVLAGVIAAHAAAKTEVIYPATASR